MLQILAYFPAIIGAAILSYMVVVTNFKPVVNKLFFWAAISVLMWLSFLFAADISSGNILQARLLLRIAIFFSLFMPILFLYFAIFYANPSKLKIRLATVLYAPIFTLQALSFSDLIVANVEFRGFGTQIVNPGLGYSLVVGITTLYLLVGLFYIYRYRKKYNTSKKKQSYQIMFGVFVSLIINLFTGYLLAMVGVSDYAILATGPAVLIFLGSIGVAVVRYGLFDIKLAAVRSVAYALSLLALAGIYYGVAYFVSIVFFSGEMNSSFSLSPLNILLALGLAFVFQPIKTFFDRITDGIFYRDRYNTSDFFAQLNQILSSTVELRGLLERASAHIATTLKSEQAMFYLRYTNGKQHIISAGTEGHTRLPVYDVGLLDEYLLQINNEAIIITDLITENSSVQKMLRSHRIALTMPLRYNKAVMGYLLLGEHQAGNYSKRDITTLEAISNGLVIATQNAISLHEIKELNATLQQRIDVATKELRSSNAQLKHLDEVKDEFMSMASHQLRTPLTSVKGYLSMVLEGDAGDISWKQRKLLMEAFKSSERMVGLIGDFLNVSRLQTGKFVIDKTSFDFGSVVRQEVQDLDLIANSHDIKLSLKMDKIKLPILADESKVRQVIMNLVDNAVYYSKPNSVIKILVERSGAAGVTFTVTDTGIGVPVSEQKHLFHKFYRAKNARQQRPDGTGVGLYLARRVVTAHGGAIIFKSTEGKGSTFGFKLPLDKKSLAALDKKSASAKK